MSDAILHEPHAGAGAGMLRVDVAGSALITRTTLIAYVATALLMTLLPGPPVVRMAVAAILLLAAWRWRRHTQRAAGRVTAVVVDPLGNWRIGLPGQAVVPARLLAPSLVLPWLTLLRFATAGNRRHVVALVGDNASPTAVRRLRVRVRAHA